LIIRELFLFFAFLVNLGLGLLVHFRAKSHLKVNLFFSVLAWAAAGWAFSGFMTYLNKGSDSMLTWARMSFTSSGVIASSFLCFALLFPRDQRRLHPAMLGLLILPSILVFLLAFGSNHIVASLGSGSRMFH
jgi:hypothetical protein